MTVALISDTHFGSKTFNKAIFERMIAYFEQVFFPYVLKQKIKHVIHLGDLVHNRNLMDNWIDGQLKKRFFRWFENNQIELTCLVGNHDSYFKNTIRHNWQQANLREFEYVTVIEEITTKWIDEVNFGFVPWITAPKQLTQFPSPQKIDILAGHFEINGALMQGTMHSKVGLEYSLFKNYKTVLSGHFHATSLRDNVRYIGTQYQMNWSDYGNKKGFWILKKNKKMEFIENGWSPKYLKLYYVEDRQGEILLKLGGINKNLKTVSFEEAREYAAKNYIKFIVKRYDNQDLLERYFEQIGKESLDRIEIINESSIIEDFDFEKFEETMNEEDTDLLSIVEKYIHNSQFSQDLDKDSLIHIVQELYNKAQSITN